LSRRGEICPPAALNYVVPFRADDMACSTSRFAVSLSNISGLGRHRLAAVQDSVSMNYAGPGHPKFLLNSFCSSLHCVFAFQERRKEGEKCVLDGLAATGPQHTPVMYYAKLI
jgi:hypothetical protein